MICEVLFYCLILTGRARTTAYCKALKSLTQSEVQFAQREEANDIHGEVPAPSTRHRASKRAPSESETRLRPKKRRMLQLSQIHRRNRFGETKVHEAVLNGNEQEVRDMIQLGASVNIPDYAGWTPLHEAVLTKQVTIMKHLLRGGAVVNCSAHNGDTPLHDAAGLGDYQMANLLLKHGADPLLKNALGMAPVDVVTNTSVAKLLENVLPQSEKGQLLGENFFFHADTF
ncbi:ankyrin repeat domain-containing protein 31 [Clupea harengus]|uniref:Ankyrin repeat domain-containing protein 31 n=1 Tax=Clupea harengus TaxID=7950 RepID=A0A8M1KVD3_CLUHA|nr:ankyrin repeat domain-containing protein 31 [Clupea harengus]